MDHLSHNSNEDDESFIVLGSTSPKTSLDAAMMESKIMEHSKSSKSSLERSENKVTEIVNEELPEYSSPLNVESIPTFKPFVSEEYTKYENNLMFSSATEREFLTDLELKVADLVRENTILKQTLAKNNAYMKDQFKSIAKWQDDMMNTHHLHKVKFGETKVLIEKLRMEKVELKKKLDQECELNLEYRGQINQIASKLQTAEQEISNIKCQCEKLKQEKDKLNNDILDVNKVLMAKVAKLEETMQENEKIQKDLEALKQEISKSDVKKENNENQSGDNASVSSMNGSFVMTEIFQEPKIARLEEITEKLTLQLKMVNGQRQQVILDNDKLCQEKEIIEEKCKRLMEENDDLKLVIRGVEEKLKKEHSQLYEGKISSLTAELKAAQEKVTEVENVKSSFDERKNDLENKIKCLTENTSELKERLREAQLIAFQPVRFSLSIESQNGSSEFINFVENVKLYDKTLKELAQYMNDHSQVYGELFDKVNTWILDFQMNKDKIDLDKLVKVQEEKTKDICETVNGYYLNISNMNHLVKSSLSFLDKLFLDYQQVLRINKDFEEKSKNEKFIADDGLVAKVTQLEIDLSKERRERQMLVEIIKTLQNESDERDLLRAQLDVYKNDFEAERESRTKLASEKEEILSSLQEVQKRNQILMEEIKKYVSSDSSPSTSRRSPARATAPSSSYQEDDSSSRKFICPLCNISLISMKMLQEHVNICIDDSTQQH